MEKRYTVAVLVRNQFGVLNRVTSMFRRRQFNIDNLTVSETESPDYSRITVQFAGERVSKQQLVVQLYKLPDVPGWFPWSGARIPSGRLRTCEQTDYFKRQFGKRQKQRGQGPSTRAWPEYAHDITGYGPPGDAVGA